MTSKRDGFFPKREQLSLEKNSQQKFAFSAGYYVVAYLKALCPVRRGQELLVWVTGFLVCNIEQALFL